MLVRSLDDLKATGRYAEKPGVFTSARYLLREDGVGFTMTQTSVAAGTRQEMAYANHVEANLVLDGHGVLTDLETGDTHDLAPGVMYTFDGHERHEIVATTDLRIVCIFRPALHGSEMHDESGAYPAPHVARWSGVVIDCADADELAAFYAALLGWEVTTRDIGWATLRDPDRGVDLTIRTDSGYRPPVWPDTASDHSTTMHFEIVVADMEAAAELIAAHGGCEAPGQPLVRDRSRSRIMLDPAGHPFRIFVAP